jgi:hypothetical protein
MGGLNPSIPLAGIQPQVQLPDAAASANLNVQKLINSVALQKQQQQQADLQTQQMQTQTQEQQQDFEDQQKFRKTFLDNAGDWNKTLAAAPGAGVGPQFLVKAQIARTDQLTKYAALTKDQLKNESDKNDALGISAQKVIDADPVNNPEAAANVYATERNQHILSGAYKDSDIPAQMPGLDQLKETAAHSKANQDMLKEAAALKATNAQLPGVQAEAHEKEYTAGAQTMAGVTNQLGWTARRKLAVANDPQMDGLIPEQYSPQAAEQVRQMGVSPKDLATVSPDKLELQDYLKKNPGKGPSDFLAWKTGTEAAAKSQADINTLNQLNAQNKKTGQTVAPGLTPEATDSVATTFHNTGQLPQGRGVAGQAQRTAVMNREREMFPGTVLSANSAEFAANKKSLGEIQPKLDQVNAFENTAVKNLDLFTGLAQKAVDSGLPILNAPWRAAAGMLGGPDQAAFNAARQVAINEIAKVTSSPGLSGQLSDSARHEVEQFIPESATVGQIMRVASVLKQDMGNRKSSYEDQITAIQGRLGGNKQAEPTGGSGVSIPSGAKTATGPGGHKIFVQDGKWIDSVTGKPL